ncbi:hypothetical protein R1flu_006095 [Riccia fluitans]|uniref:Uncharacterized protein n=1 Tax=Riccia fluitans TaxID=41844 RepID=A0ABD1YV27_9MARC
MALRSGTWTNASGRPNGNNKRNRTSSGAPSERNEEGKASVDVRERGVNVSIENVWETGRNGERTQVGNQKADGRADKLLSEDVVGHASGTVVEEVKTVERKATAGLKQQNTRGR